MYKAIKKFTIARIDMRSYLNPNREVYVKTKRCHNCNTVYVVNPDCRRLHEQNRCEHLRPGYNKIKRK